MDHEKTNQAKIAPPRDSKSVSTLTLSLQDALRRLRSESGHAKPGQEKIEAALEAAQKLALQMDSDASVAGIAEGHEQRPCHSCGGFNPRENRFCARCGVPLHELPDGDAPAPEAVKLINPLQSAAGQHHYHHHYHHHYFATSNEATSSVPEARVSTGPVPRDTSKARPAGAGLSRAEIALRKLAQDWALACNTKHLDDLVDLYTSDAIVLRPNVSPVRSAAAIRELFCSVVEAGLGEVEMEPLRVEVFGEIAYEVGRCSMLAPSATGKRREERGKYVILAARQAGEWKILVDCWSTDLSVTLATEPAKVSSAITPAVPRASSKNT
ncbi:MAG TPA: nuclear transport factor 2 family protein [Terriglobales bacterium]|nr:nuclear transport factor 2 family protein [Terriglobales bacterium]